jgi:hypothetical protein
LPVGVSGHDPKAPAKSAYDPAAARALLDRFGYKDRDGDGFRELPDGKPLVLVQSSDPSSLSREANTLWVASMKAIGLKMTINTQPFGDLLKAANGGQLMMYNLGNRSNAPSGYNILGQMWGKAPPDQNHSRFRNADYDAAFEKFLRTPDGPERVALARRMSDIVANLGADHDPGLPGRSCLSRSRGCRATFHRPSGSPGSTWTSTWRRRRRREVGFGNRIGCCVTPQPHVFSMSRVVACWRHPSCELRDAARVRAPGVRMLRDDRCTAHRSSCSMVIRRKSMKQNLVSRRTLLSLAAALVVGTSALFGVTGLALAVDVRVVLKGDEGSAAGERQQRPATASSRSRTTTRLPAASRRPGLPAPPRTSMKALRERMAR